MSVSRRDRKGRRRRRARDWSGKATRGLGHQELEEGGRSPPPRAPEGLRPLREPRAGRRAQLQRAEVAEAAAGVRAGRVRAGRPRKARLGQAPGEHGRRPLGAPLPRALGRVLILLLHWDSRRAARGERFKQQSHRQRAQSVRAAALLAARRTLSTVGMTREGVTRPGQPRRGQAILDLSSVSLGEPWGLSLTHQGVGKPANTGMLSGAQRWGALRPVPTGDPQVQGARELLRPLWTGTEDSLPPPAHPPAAPCPPDVAWPGEPEALTLPGGTL